MSVTFATDEIYPLALPCAVEGTTYSYNTGGHILVMMMPRPTGAEKNSINRGPCEFGLFVDGPAIFLLARFLPALPWQDAPFTIHKEPQQQRELPSLPKPGERALLQIHLVDTTNGVLAAQRAVMLGPEFTLALHQAIRDQASQSWNRMAFDRHVQEIYQSYLPQDLCKKAIVKHSQWAVYF